MFALRGVASRRQGARPVGESAAQPNEGVKVQVAVVQSVCAFTISPRGRWVLPIKCLYASVLATGRRPQKGSFGLAVQRFARQVAGRSGQVFCWFAAFPPTAHTPRWVRQTGLAGCVRQAKRPGW